MTYTPTCYNMLALAEFLVLFCCIRIATKHTVLVHSSYARLDALRPHPTSCLSIPRGVFPPSMNSSPPDVEMRRGIDHVITVLQRPMACVESNYRKHAASLVLILVASARTFSALKPGKAASAMTADAGEFCPSQFTAWVEITSKNGQFPADLSPSISTSLRFGFWYVYFL